MSARRPWRAVSLTWLVLIVGMHSVGCSWILGVTEDPVLSEDIAESGTADVAAVDATGPDHAASAEADVAPVEDASTDDGGTEQ